MQLLRRALKEGSSLLSLHANDISSVFRAVLDLVTERGYLDVAKRDDVLAALNERERLGSTAIGHAVAVPHAYLECFREQVVVPVRLDHPINLGAPDGIPTRFIFVLLGPDDGTVDHVDTLMHIAQLMADDEFRFEAGEARDEQEMLAALDRFEQRSLLPPPAEPVAVEDDALAYTGKLWGGVKADWRRRLPWYRDDFRAGFHPKVLSSTLFLFFACLAPAITFGGIMAEYTGDHIGVVEMIVATAITGVIYALFSGQPLIILGGTGPLLVFTMILYQLTWRFRF